MDDDEPRVLLGVFVEDCSGAVGGAVIDSEDFEVLIRLRQKGVEAFTEVAIYVVDRNDDSDSAVDRGGLWCFIF